jgi:16S rRNA (guanine527-N7)-methyltransferase
MLGKTAQGSGLLVLKAPDKIGITVLDETQISELLEPFGVSIDGRQAEQVRAFLELLVRWNRKLNLTAITNPADCVTRHFGESFYFGSILSLEGRLLDIGSGAGFPGLALKIWRPAIKVCLLEPNTKKHAFLKEAARVCELQEVEVRRQRIEEYIASDDFVVSDIVTSRAVNPAEGVLSRALACTAKSGLLCLWTTGRLVTGIEESERRIKWVRSSRIPNTKDRVILIGQRRSSGDIDSIGIEAWDRKVG